MSGNVVWVRAYVDESVHGATPGLYVLASVAVSQEQAENVRDELRQGLRHRRGRFHWRDEEDGDKRAMAKMVGQLQLPGLVAVASPIDPSRPERARRVYLTRLLWELGQRQVLDVMLETRHQRDIEDRQHIAQAQRIGHVRSEMAYGFGAPLQEPLLWLPDLVAGAVAYSLARGVTEYLEQLGPSVVVVEAGAGT